MLYLVMALVWLSVGVAAFVMPRVNQAANPWVIPGTEISVGWVALFFFIYNLVRWWTLRGKDRDRRLLRPTPAKPLHHDQPPDPNFKFSEEPPK